jgi:hypothetical protein
MDLVLVTDGEPTGCTANDVATVTAEVSAALASSIRTFVIAIGTDAGTANQIASAGGTTTAYMVTPGANATQDVRGAFEAAYQDPCAFRLPDAAGGSINWSEVNVVVRSAAQPDTLVYNVGDEGGCSATSGGWYLENPGSPTRVELCPTTCNVVRAYGMETVYQVGCPTIQAP